MSGIESFLLWQNNFLLWDVTPCSPKSFSFSQVASTRTTYCSLPHPFYQSLFLLKSVISKAAYSSCWPLFSLHWSAQNHFLFLRVKITPFSHARLILVPWRWRPKVPPKFWERSTRLYDVRSPKAMICMPILLARIRVASVGVCGIVTVRSQHLHTIRRPPHSCVTFTRINVKICVERKNTAILTWL
jgi:hypothetical protein